MGWGGSAVAPRFPWGPLTTSPPPARPGSEGRWGCASRAPGSARCLRALSCPRRRVRAGCSPGADAPGTRWASSLPQDARARKSLPGAAPFAPLLQSDSGLGPPFLQGLESRFGTSPESRHAVCSKVSSPALPQSCHFCAWKAPANSPAGRAPGRPKCVSRKRPRLCIGHLVPVVSSAQEAELFPDREFGEGWG